MNPFIDPEISRNHFPDFEAGLKEVCNNSEEEDDDDGPLEWSIDTLAHMAAIGSQGGDYLPGERVSFFQNQTAGWILCLIMARMFFIHQNC